MPESPRYIAFWSYTRFDDENDRQKLTDFRVRLEKEVRAVSGQRVEIFQDIEAIKWGDSWSSRMERSEDDSVFLIPIITPNYFESDACRKELRRFIGRERSMGLKSLILPMYYITAPQLEEPFKHSDPLVKVIHDHQYEDLRECRHKDIDSFEVREIITRLARRLKDRFRDVSRWYVRSEKMQGMFTEPPNYSRVPRRSPVLGTVRRVPEQVEVWLTIQAGSRYHPQAHLPRGPWQGIATLGREGDFDQDQEFNVQILAVTEDVSKTFERYCDESSREKKWLGVSQPPDSDFRILDGHTLIRDNSASAFAFMEGTYEEYSSSGVATHGTIQVKLRTANILLTEATNEGHTKEWTGEIKMELTKPIRGEGEYKYEGGKTDYGLHRLTVDSANGDLIIEGRNTSQPNGVAFRTLWKKRK